MVDTFGQAQVERRRNGKKVEKGIASQRGAEMYDYHYYKISTDGQAVLWDGLDFLDLLYGHLSHKEGKGELVHRWIYGVQEAYGSTIVMQFDMPEDQSLVLDSCTTVKKGKRSY